jgi:hypothetical protein
MEVTIILIAYPNGCNLGTDWDNLPCYILRHKKGVWSEEGTFSQVSLIPEKDIYLDFAKDGLQPKPNAPKFSASLSFTKYKQSSGTFFYQKAGQEMPAIGRGEQEPVITELAKSIFSIADDLLGITDKEAYVIRVRQALKPFL